MVAVWCQSGEAEFPRSVTRCPLEGDDQRAEAAVLRGAVASEQAAHGGAPRVPVPAAAQAHLHRRRQEAAHLRVQGADAAAAAGDAQSLVSGRHGRPARPAQPGHAGRAGRSCRRRSSWRWRPLASAQSDHLSRLCVPVLPAGGATSRLLLRAYSQSGIDSSVHRQL